MEPLREIEQLVAFEGRVTGSDAERRAARHLAGRLEALGREADVEPIRVHPRWPLLHALHATLAVVGSVLSVDAPVAGAAILALVTLSTFADLTGAAPIARRLFGYRASQNVVSREDADKPGTLVLVAHYDTGRTGAVFGPRLTERRAALGNLIRRPIGVFEPFFWSIALIFACTLIRLPEIEPLALTIVQFVPTVVLIVSVPLLLDIPLSGAVPGAGDNASGVATVLRLADRYGERLDHLDLWVLLTGAGESLQAGMRAWLRQHRAELDPRRTIFLGVDEVGRGTVRYARKEGFVLASPYHPALVELCDEIAEEEESYGARSIVSRSASDPLAARTRRFPAIAISCRNALDYVPHHHLPTDTADRIDPDALERAHDFCAELIELIDERLGPEIDATGAEPLPEAR